MSDAWSPQHDLSTSRKPALTRRAHTLAAHGPDGFHMMLDPAHRAALFGSINVKEAECSKAQDKAKILDKVGFGKQRAPTVRLPTSLTSLTGVSLPLGPGAQDPWIH